MSREEDWQAATRILCVRLDSLGDLLMTSPAIRAVKRAGAAVRHVTLWTSPAASDMAALLPEVDDVMIYSAPWMKSAGRSETALDRRMILSLRSGHFDAAIIFTVYSQNPLPAALACYLADIPLRLAYCRENPYRLLTDWIPETEPDEGIRHEVERQLSLVKRVGFQTGDNRLRLNLPKAALRRIREKISRAGIDIRRPWAVIHPGASAPSRRYPPEGFATAAGMLARTDGWQIVFTGCGAERGLVESIRASMNAPSVSMAGMLSLSELAALLSMAPVLIVNNTGPAHIAAAVGTPVVDLYALTNPQHTPWGVAHRLLYHDVGCRFCYKSVCPEKHHDCLRRVPPDAIVKAAKELALEGASDGRSNLKQNGFTCTL